MISPAPWSSDGKDIYVRDKDGQMVCLVGALATREDARLIASAPDLLDALKALKDVQSQCGGYADDFSQRVWIIADMAIAKAEGK